MITRLSLEYDSYRSNTSEPDPDDSWSRASTTTDWSLYYLYPDGSGELHADFPVEVGDRVYLVYAIYSTGDSFGHDHASDIALFTVHRDRETALRNVEILRSRSNCYVEGKFDTNITIYTDGGTAIPQYVPWLGYFENLERCEAEEFVVRHRR